MRLIVKRDALPPTDSAGFHFLSEYQTYGLKSRSFFFSALFHLAVGVALILQKNTATASPSRPIYETLIQPEEKKIVWRHLQAELPNIDSSTKRPKEGPARGRTRAKQVAIAESKNGSKSEFVWQETPIELPKPVKAPNLIALHPPSVPAPAPPPPPKLRDFVPPPMTSQPQPAQPAALPVPAPPVAIANPQLTASLPSIAETSQPKIYRAFVAPPSQKTGTGTSAGTETKPMPDAPSSTQASNSNIAAINLDHLLGESPVVPGRRPGNFSTAPTEGAPSVEKGGRGLVPGLTTRGRNTADSEPAVKPEAPSIPKREVLYREIMSHVMGSSLSVPLPPGARRIPDAVDSQFRNRPVYTMMLPAPKMPQYAGDWIIWFGEQKATQAMGAIRAPLPEKKLVSDAPPNTWGTEADIQINLVIDETGHVQSLSILKIPPDVSPQLALDDVREWQFKPATRNGVPIAVDAILDIPYRRLVAAGTKR